jgi:predicted glutamine amidotransferase
MLAKISSLAESFSYELLDAPHSLYQQSKCGKQPNNPSLCGPHDSGCGLAFFSKGDLVLNKCNAEDSWGKEYQDLIRQSEANLVIAHNRKASPGLKVDRSCSHPFQAEYRGIPIAFCHNGGIHSLIDEAKARGVSDSQIFFDEIIKDLGEINLNTIAARLKDLRQKWTYSSMTALLLTPQNIFAWRIYDTYSADVERYEAYYTLYSSVTDSKVLVASEPIDYNSSWEVLKNGKILSIGLGGSKIVVEEKELGF